jgi:hypothetical protein
LSCDKFRKLPQPGIQRLELSSRCGSRRDALAGRKQSVRYVTYLRVS